MVSSAREPAVAGLFYPEKSQQLIQLIHSYYEKHETSNRADIKALLVPHAGFIYSGEIAASAYHKVLECKNYQRTLLLGPSHRIAFKGLAVTNQDVYRSPLGDLQVDMKCVTQLLDQGFVQLIPEAHFLEHSLEVQLPFIQTTPLAQLPIVPLVVGDASADDVNRVLEAMWQPGDLIIVSSDLSHYLTYQQAKEKDARTSGKICHLQYDLRGHEACGCRAINGLNRWAHDHNWQVECVDLKNSGDTAGDKNRVVGYGAYVFY